MMKKYLPYIVAIIALATAAGWFFMNQSKGTISEREGDFAVNDAREIFRVVLADTEKNSVELFNNNGVWMVNGKYAAREDLIKNLLDAITRVTSLCPVPNAAHDNVVRDMAKRNTHVQVYNSKNKLLKSYYVGGPNIDGTSTYMLLEYDGQTAARPHMTYIPGFKGYLTPRFNTDEETWRTRVLFNYKQEEIKELKVQYPADEKNSFTITRLAADSFVVSPVDEKYLISSSYEQKYIRQYLSFYSSIFIEAFDNQNEERDSLTRSTPYCIIRVTENDNTVNEVKLFYMPLNKRSKKQVDEKGNEMPYDLDRYYATIHDERDFVIVQYYVFGKLLRNYKDFFFKPA